LRAISSLSLRRHQSRGYQAGELLEIPVSQDDQPGTTIIDAALLVNALRLTDRTLDRVKDARQRPTAGRSSDRCPKGTDRPMKASAGAGRSQRVTLFAMVPLSTSN
jgi:hypothetical protein